MTKAERVAALAPHIKAAGDQYHEALDAACGDPSPETIAALDKAVLRCDALDELRVAAETSSNG